MNNTTTKNLTAIVAVFMAAILVVGTFVTTPSTAFAAKNNNNSGNTITVQKCKQAATESGFDNTEEQECANLICTHPSDNCVQEGVTTPTPQPPTTTTTLLVKKVVVCTTPGSSDCQPSKFGITVTGTNNPNPASFPASESGTLVTFSGPGTYTIIEGPIPPSFLPSNGGITTFSGDCTKTMLFNTATGTISAGEHQTCIITNIQEGAPPPPPA